MPPANDDAQQELRDRSGEAFEPVVTPDGALLYACTEWCSLLRSCFAADFAEAE